MATAGEFLSFTELVPFSPDFITFIEIDGNPQVTSIGEGIEFIGNLYQKGTNVFDSQPPDDEILGVKRATSIVIDQLGNGDFIFDNIETVEIFDKGNGEPSGEIFTEGFINGTGLENLETQTVPITGGTGDFKNTRGVEDITQLRENALNIVDLSFRTLSEINGTRSDDNIVGKKDSELITGNNGNDTIRGGQGNDIIEGGRGGDIIRGGAGDDTLAADRTDRFQDFDGSNSELRGDNGNDIIYGGSKDDFIGGGNDNDLLFGKDGDDLIIGGNGFDLLNGGVGNDTLRGQGGIDVANYSDLTFDGVYAAVAGLDVNLNTNKAKHSSNNNRLNWIDTLTTIENVTGTSRNDRFIGDENNNVFNGFTEVGRNNRQTKFIGLDGSSYEVIGDVVEYDGNQSEFTFGTSTGKFTGLTVTGDGIGTDILIGIEFIKFSDALITTDSINL